MSKEQKRRGGVALMALLFLLAAVFPLASLADGDASGDGVPAGTVRNDRIIDLGMVPDETAAESVCDVLIVADIATGMLLHEKNIAAKIPVPATAVQLLLVLTALDYVSVDDVITVSEAQAEQFPTEGSLFGLAAGCRVYVGDLIVSMLRNNAADSGMLIEELLLNRSGATQIGPLMVQKAASLGMTDTDYSQYDSDEPNAIRSTALDQCRLYLTALACETLQGLLENTVYSVRSKAAFATPTPEPTPASRYRRKPPENTDPNAALPDQLVGELSAVVPESPDYDVRLSCAVSGNAEAFQRQYGVAFLRAVEYRSDIAILYWSQADASGIAAKTCSDLADIFSRRKIVNLVPYLQASCSALSVEKNGLKIGGWSIAEDYVLYGRQMVGYDPDLPERSMPSFELSKMTVHLQADTGTLVTNADGSRSIRATVLINNTIADTITLFTAGKVQNTDIASQDAVELFTDDDVIPAQPSLMEQYGWYILIGAAALLALFVIVVGVLIRNRMER